MDTHGYLCSVGAPRWLAHEVDLWFLADLCRGVEWNARFDVSSAVDARARACQMQVAAGTLDALMWVLGPVLLSPASGTRRADRSQSGLVDELELAVRRRDGVRADGPDWYYLGGLADGLEFALGLRRPFWWAPLLDEVRLGPPKRDPHGFSV